MIRRRRKAPDPAKMAEIAEAQKEAKRRILRRLYVKTPDPVGREIIKNEALDIPQMGRRRIVLEDE